MPDLDAKIRIRLEVDEAKRDAERAGKDQDKVEKRREKKKEREKRRVGVVGRTRKGVAGVAAKTAGIVGSLYLLGLAAPAIAGFTTEMLSPILPDIMEKKIREWVNDIVGKVLTPVITAARAALPALEQTRQLAGATAILGGTMTSEDALERFQQMFAIGRAKMTGELAVERLTKEMFGVLLAKWIKDLVGIDGLDAETVERMTKRGTQEQLEGRGPRGDKDLERGMLDMLKQRFRTSD